MKAAVILLAIALPAEARANEAFLEEMSLPSKEVSLLPRSLAAGEWSGWPSHKLTAVPQITVMLNDGEANRKAQTNPPRALLVRAAYDRQSLGVVVEWSDPSESRPAPGETNSFGDSIALEFPQQFGAGIRLPYIGMGDEQQPALLYLARATAGGFVERDAVAAGFGSSTRADLGEMKRDLVYDASAKVWRAYFVRPLQTRAGDLRRGLVPFALALFDGAAEERGGNKAITGWHFLRLSRYPLDAAYLKELSWGWQDAERGDPVRGKQLTETLCAACHWVGARRTAPPGLGPDLTTIGAISTPAYLRDSIIEPSQIIVPRAGWYAVDPAGKKTSIMPPLGTLPPADIGAIVSYLRTLGGSQ